MNQKQAKLFIGGIVILIAIGAIFYFQSDIQNLVQRDNPQNNIVASVDIANIRCPLELSQCEFADVYEASKGGITIAQIGYYNVASISPVFAVFDGELSVINTRNLDKQLILKNGDLTAVYRFIGDIPGELQQGSIKEGSIIGILNKRISYYDDKYNFVFGILNEDTKNSRKIEFNEGNTSFRIID